MKNIIKSRIFAFILGAVIFGSIGIVSAYTILAKDVGYNPKDTTWKVTNVKDAIDDLYEELDTSSVNASNAVDIAAHANSYTYTFTKDYKYIIVTYATRYVASTNYSISGNLSETYSKMTGSNTIGLFKKIYKDVKVGDQIKISGGNETDIIITGLE